jgi:serine/threonine protein kinase
MEYIEGETLKEYLERNGKLSDAEIKNLFSQMLEAVGSAEFGPLLIKSPIKNKRSLGVSSN